MSSRKSISKMALLLAGAMLLPVSLSTTPALAEGLVVADCVKCHERPPQDILEAGESHRTEVSCIDCHEGHAPKSGDDIIPSCSQCHEGTDHFELENCLSCHTNPHTPLIISIGNNITKPCLTCHTDQMEQLQQHESKHTQQDCSSCHRSTHGMIPDCTNCHSPHAKFMTQKDCLTCHKPHMPLEVSYPDEIPSESCAACHNDVLNMLNKNEAKHKTLSCATCHQKDHKKIPRCQNCHGETPHPAKMHEKFPECGMCHGIAHDLNK